jgi:hypothetical protein
MNDLLRAQALFLRFSLPDVMNKTLTSYPVSCIGDIIDADGIQSLTNICHHRPGAELHVRVILF